MLIPLALEIRERFPVSGAPPNADQLMALIDEKWLLAEKPIAHIFAWNVAEELTPYYEEATPPAVQDDT